jgi:hypothetical protein
MLRPCVTLFSALAALTELAACVAIVHDRAHARDKFFSRIAWFGMLFGAIAFLAAVLQWRAALAAAQPISGGGVILLGYGAWAAILA